MNPLETIDRLKKAEEILRRANYDFRNASDNQKELCRLSVCQHALAVCIEAKEILAEAKPL